MECVGPASNPSNKVTANQPPTSKHLPNASGNVHNANGCKGRCQQITCSWNSHHANLSLAALVVSSKNHLCKRTEITGAAVLERCLQRENNLTDGSPHNALWSMQRRMACYVHNIGEITEVLTITTKITNKGVVEIEILCE